jgi:hypothetical protein
LRSVEHRSQYVRAPRITIFLAGLPAATRNKFRFRPEDALSLKVSL